MHTNSISRKTRRLAVVLLALSLAVAMSFGSCSMPAGSATAPGGDQAAGTAAGAAAGAATGTPVEGVSERAVAIAGISGAAALEDALITVDVAGTPVEAGSVYTFGEAAAGFDPSLFAVTFNITNTSSGELTNLAASYEYSSEEDGFVLDVTEINDADGVLKGGSSLGFALEPVAGLPAGVYTGDIVVSYDETGISDRTIDGGTGSFSFSISFTVAGPVVDAQAPVISAHPQSQAVTVGGAAGLSVAASVTDGGTLSYQWYSNQAQSATGGTAVGTNSPTFTAPANFVGTTFYYVVVTNTNTAVNGSQTAAVTSNVATVTVSAALVAPAITSANNTNSVFGTGRTFQVTATGTAPISFSLSGAPSGVSIDSSTGLITIATSAAAGTHTFTIVADNGVQPGAAQSFVLTIARRPIQTAGITVTAPVSGNTSVAAAGITSGANFTVSDVIWSPGDTTFAANTQYTATVVLTAGANHTFTGGLETAQINGNPATITNNSGATVRLSFTFPATDAAAPPQNGGDDAQNAPNGEVVTADSGSVPVGFTQAGSTVTLDLNHELVDEIISGAEGSVIDIDLTGVRGANEVVKPAAALMQVANAGLSLDILMPQGTVRIDVLALASIAAQAEYDNVSLLLNRADTAALSQAQRDALGAGDLVFNIRIMSGSQAIRSFNGFLTVTLPYDGPLPAAIWYLDDFGNMEQMDSTYDPETMTVSFMTTHLSLYVVGSDAGSAIADDGMGGGAQAPASNHLPIILLIAGLAAIGAVFVIRRTRAGANG